MKRSMALILIFCLIFTLAACATASADGNHRKKITVCLDWTPNTNHTGLYVAQQKGYYEQAGLQVELVQPPENGAVMMCASGQAQFAVDAQDTLAAALVGDSPLGVTAVAALIQHNTSGIISRAGEGMDTPAGLAGKTYSTWDNPIEQAMLRYVVEQDGGAFSSVRLIPNVITDEAAALKTKQTDAVWVFYGWGGIAAKQSGLDFDYWSFADRAAVLDYYTPVLVANNGFLENQPEVAKAFLQATQKGYEFAIDNPEQAAELLIAGDTTGALNDSRELVLESQQWLATRYKAEVEQWGYIDPARWDGFYAWLYQNGLIETQLAAGTGFSNEYLQ